MKKHWLFTWRGWTKSIGVRFALVAFLFQLVMVVGTGVYAEQKMKERFERHEKVPVIRSRDSAMAEYRVGGIDGLARLMRERVSNQYSHDVAFLLAAPDGKILAGNLKHWPTHLVGNSHWSTGLVRVQGVRFDQHMGLITTPIDGGYRLLVGTAIISGERVHDVYVWTMWLSIGLAALNSILIAWIASHMIARQLSGIIDLATSVAEGDYTMRLTTNGSGDRFDALMHWINRTMDRLEGKLGELQLVSAGLAHDLRSPITRLRVTLERALTESKDPVSLDAMQKMLVETDTLLAMLAMTLQISNAEAGTSRDRFTMTDVKTLLMDIAEIYGPLAEEKGFTISVNAAEGMSKILHRELLGQALSNLIENALKYADGGSKIVLSAGRQPDLLNISAADDGVGIPAHRLDDARRRYGRLDSARRLPGAGLGLSLVEAVAKLHGGGMAFADNAPGLVVTMTFPAKKF